MTPQRTFSTAHRVLTQLRHDHRTLVLVFIIPPVLLTILKYVFDDQVMRFNHISPVLLGIFPMTMMFVVASIVTLRERSDGTLRRLMTTPMAKLDFIVGYAIAFCILGIIQAAITSLVMIGPLGVDVAAGEIPTLFVAMISAFLGTAMGLFTSAFARTEFQAVQFLPAFIFPQLLVCGLFVDRARMTLVLRWMADGMPLTYAVEAMQQLTTNTGWTNTLTKDVLIIFGFVVAFLILGSLTIRRRES